MALKRIEAAREIARTVGSSRNHVYINADNLMFDLVAMMDAQTRDTAARNDMKSALAKN